MSAAANSNNDLFWVIGGGLLQLPLIDEVKKLGFQVIVSDLSPHCPARSKADYFFAIDIFDIPGHLAAVEKLKSENKSIVGVLAAGIDAPETMAVVSKKLGLKAVNPEVARTVNNKGVFRDVMRKLGHPVPKFKVVNSDNLHELESIVNEISFPLIVKNTDSSGSRGTKIFRSLDLPEIKNTVNAAIDVSRSKCALIEECWEGPEQTVETIFDINGKFHPCFITDRIFDKQGGFALETALRHPSSLPESTQKEMYAIAETVARDIGIDVGAAKYDMMLTKNGPRIIEMTTRLSGGFDCQYLVPAATGKNVLKAAILTALGKEFDPAILVDTKHRVALSESIWPKPGKIVSITGIEEAKKVPGFEQIFFRNQVGDTIQPYIDCTKRVCFIIVSGSDEKEARKTMDTIKDKIKIETV